MILERATLDRIALNNFEQSLSKLTELHQPSAKANKTEPFIRGTYIKWLMHYLNTL